MKTFKLNLFFILSFCVIPLCAQKVHTYNNQSYTITDQRKTDGQKKVFIATPPKELIATDLDDTIRVIVKLKRSPLLALTSEGRVNATEAIDDEHRNFLEYLKELEGSSSSSRSGTKATVILSEYKSSYNGFAIITTKRLFNELKQSKHVYSTSVSKKVRAVDVTSNQVIRAPEAWTKFGVTGSGITIGIIDTGIDYNHPDLGGGFGSSFKVIGGYDFFNNDSDPMDDNGHGTHVAGIAAADGISLKGVAPKAKLVAYKVLGAEGYGYDDQILAAIERATDPDQNPATSDALDVVNMSLGRAADPLEPYSEAVNNAVNAGVTFVVAAGNAYDFFTVGTPAIAEKAITVGAVDNTKLTAFFSSKGPVERTFALKPDVAAPGVDIYSSMPNNTYQNLNGTSMAAPHVAGAAALLLDKNPTWTPKDVKAAFMNTAIQGGSSIWEQGAGVIDIVEALESITLVSPASISLGRPETNIAVWTKKIPFSVKNVSGALRTYTLTATSGINNGPIETIFSDGSFALSPGEEKQVTITFKVTTADLETKSIPDCYSGHIEVAEGGRKIRCIVSMPNPQVTKIKFTNELPWSSLVVGTEGSSYFKVVPVTSAEHEVYLPVGTYDILTYYIDNSTVINEGINTSQNITITQDKSMAKNAISFQPLNKAGNPLLPDLASLPGGSGLFYSAKANFISIYLGFVSNINLSDMGHYRLDLFFHGKGSDGKYYEVYTKAADLKESKVLSNDPSSFNKVTIRNPSIAVSEKQNMLYYTRAGLEWFYITTWNNSPQEMTNPIEVYQSKAEPGVNILGNMEIMPPGESEGYTWLTAPMKTQGDQLIFFNHFSTKIDSVKGEYEYNLGKSMLGANGFLYTASTTTGLYDFPGKGIFRRTFGECENGNVGYKLFSGGTLVKKGFFHNAGAPFAGSGMYADLPNAQLQLDLEYKDYQVGGNFGKATVSYVFDTRAWDPNPPTLAKLSLKANEIETNEFTQGESAVITLRTIDHCSDNFYCGGSGLSYTTLRYKKSNSSTWINLPLSGSNGDVYQSTLPQDIPEGYYSLQISAGDATGNSFTMELSPAFLVGQRQNEVPYSTVRLISPRNFDINAGIQPQFTWSPIPGANQYTLELATQPDFSDAQSHLSTSASFQLPTSLLADNVYYWRVKAALSTYETNYSPFHQFTSGTLQPPTLITPANNSFGQPSNVQANWSAVPNAWYYIYEISSSPDLVGDLRQEYISSNYFVNVNLLPFQKYYWRVTAVVTNFFETYYLPSETWSFTTGDGTVMGIDEEEEKYHRWYGAPNPFAQATILKGFSRRNESATLVVQDQLGREIYRQVVSLNEGENSIEWSGISTSGSTVPSGLYTAHILSETKDTKTIRLSIRR